MTSVKKDTRMRFTIFFAGMMIIVCTLWAPPSAAQDEVYRWVDENGVVHFGDRAPQQQEAEVVSIPQSSGVTPQSPYNPGPVEPADGQEPQPSAAQQARDARAEARQEREAKAEVIAKNCETARNVISQLEPSPRVNVTHEDGTVTRMDDNDRLEELARARAFVSENCDK
jgi:hypothetical protein